MRHKLVNTYSFEEKCMWVTEQGFETGICQIQCRITGHYYPATLEDPEEHPELEILEVIDIITGDNITDLIVGEDKLEEKAWEHIYTTKNLYYGSDMDYIDTDL